MEAEIRTFLRLVRHRWWIFASAMVATMAVAVGLTAVATPIYQAQAKLFVGSAQVASNEISVGVQVAQLSQLFLQTYASIIKTRPIAQRAVETGSLPISADALAASIQAQPQLNTQLILLTYQSSDRALAARAVNAVADAFTEEIERIQTPNNPDARPAVQVSVVEPAVQPKVPISPSKRRNVMLGAIFGALLGFGVATLVENADKTLKTGEDAEALAGAPILATIPRIEEPASVINLRNDQSASAEAYRKLRSAIQFLGVEEPIRTILVTSPVAGEGKTTISINLARAFAQAGHKTVLIEADLRRPSFHRVFPRRDDTGLTSMLIGNSPPESCIIPSGQRNLWYVPAGAIPPNPSELLASKRMASYMRKLAGSASADVVVVDSAPLLPVADTAALLQWADGVVLVARAKETQRHNLKAASSLVSSMGGAVLGVVFNCLAPQDAQYGDYGYYYGSYGSAKASRRSGSDEDGVTEFRSQPEVTPDPSAAAAGPDF